MFGGHKKFYNHFKEKIHKLIIHNADTIKDLCAATEKNRIEILDSCLHLSYRTTPTAAHQTITGIMSLHLNAQQEAIFINVTCLRKEIEFEGLSCQPRDYEEKNQEPNYPSIII
ncbi:hypothetical protein AVEN_9126-1 [Araneus ventricosus]|uniref:Uncharacterized protein n=1 Tax=Araneus ventricosus TaxID=182803 RepID=A0A4Y2RD05_ARAVE|nr:hypothetical protein AVEN_9126-1 [Araneus ventricosus]